jgi:hypothetical protein
MLRSLGVVTLLITFVVFVAACENMQSGSPGQTGSSQTVGQTASEIYYSQVRASLLQDVPELARSEYISALNYTAQRMTDLNKDYGLSLSQIRAPITKWIQANIDWDKRGERLVPLAKSSGFLSDSLFWNSNFSLTGKEPTTVYLSFQENPSKALEYHIDEMIEQHYQIWADIHDPEKLEIYLDHADAEIPVWWAETEATKYKAAIRQHGTYEDKAHWALVGRAGDYAAGKFNEELARNEIPLAMILAIGGDAEIATNIQVKELPAPSGTDPRSRYVTRGDRQLAIRISPELEKYIRDNPDEFGTPIDSDYLQPNLPNRQSVDALDNVSKGDVKMMLVFRQGSYPTIAGNNRTWLIGDAELSKRIGSNY